VTRKTRGFMRIEPPQGSDHGLRRTERADVLQDQRPRVSPAPPSPCAPSRRPPSPSPEGPAHYAIDSRLRIWCELVREITPCSAGRPTNGSPEPASDHTMRSRRTGRHAGRHDEVQSPPQRRGCHRYHSTFGEGAATGNAAPMPGKPHQGYVQTWLHHTATRASERLPDCLPTAEAIPESSAAHRRAAADHQTWRPRHLPVDGHFYELGMQPDAQRRQKTVHRRHASRSPDSSIITSPEDPRRDLDPDLVYSKREKKRRRVSSPLNEEAPLGDEKPFGKQARRKTREDRYEPGRGGKPSTARKARDGSTTKRRRLEKSRAPRLTSAREVMDNFASKAILNERLTVCCHSPSNRAWIRSGS